MWRFRTNASAALFLLFCGCGLISFEHLGVTVWPHDPDSVVATGATPWVEFPDSPDRASVQRLFTLTAPDGQVSGDFRWDGRRLYFDAAPALPPGVRYVLAFRGRVTLENGRAFDANEEIPFYVGHAGTGPALRSSDPPDGAVCGIHRPLILRFTAPINPNSFAQEFDLQPSGETVVTWDAAAQVATIAPKDAWSNLATFSWSAGKDLTAPDGTPTGIEYSGRFRVQEDSSAPTVSSVVPAIRDAFSPTGNDLDHTGADDAILLLFSEDIRSDSFSAAFILTPSTKGVMIRVAPGLFAFVPESRLTMDQRYTLRIAPTVEDLSGNKLAFPYERSFTPDIPIQEVQSVKAVYATTEDEWTVFNTLDAKPITIGVDGNLQLVIRFKEPFIAESGARLVSAITLEGYFPSALAAPSLVTAFWTGGRTLSLTYTGLQKSAPGIGRYYKLTLPGDAAVSDNGSGSFLKEDVWMYFLASQ